MHTYTGKVPYAAVLDCHMMNFVCVTHLSHLSADAPLVGGPRAERHPNNGEGMKGWCT